MGNRDVSQGLESPSIPGLRPGGSYQGPTTDRLRNEGLNPKAFVPPVARIARKRTPVGGHDSGHDGACGREDRAGDAESAGFVGRGLLLLIAAYQRWVSPLMGPHCRFHPTCSTYTAQAVARYGALLGLIRGLGRIARCHPFHAGGYDPVP